MKTLLTLAVLTITQPAFSKIVSGTIDTEAKQVRLMLNVSNYCNDPQFKIVESYCMRRRDGPCYFTLVQTVQNKMACRPGTTGLVPVTLPATETMLDESNSIYLDFNNESFQLRDAAFWKR